MEHSKSHVIATSCIISAPPNNVYVKVNAIILRAHWPSLLWLNQLSLATVRSVQNMLQDLGIVVGTKDLKEEEHTDIRIEALMPKVKYYVSCDK